VKWGEYQDCLKAVRMEQAPDVSSGTALVVAVLNLWVATSGSKSTYMKSNPITGLEGSRRLRFPDFKTIGT
jgi:hypothetical protein